MGLFDIFKKKPAPAVEEPQKPAEQAPAPKISGFGAPYLMEGGYERSVMVERYDGEVTPEGVGPAKLYSIQHNMLRLRCKQLYLENPMAGTIIDKREAWVVGEGLTLKCEPQMDVLEAMGIEFDRKEFKEKVESFMAVYSGSTMCDYAGEKTLKDLLTEAQIEREIGGDMLVILRVIDGVVKIQHVDGQYLINPPDARPMENTDTQGYDFMLPNGNRVRQGVEIDKRGKHIAYHVITGAGYKVTRIKAYSDSSGLRMAYLVKGKSIGIGSTRGVPVQLSAIETANKVMEYFDATLTSAKERAKNLMFFTHDKESTQESVLEGDRVKRSSGFGGAEAAADAGIPVTDDGVMKLTAVTLSENAMIRDLPKGVDVKTLDAKQELAFPDFTKFGYDVMAASSGIPPSVARSKYEGSFSSARMEGKDFENSFKRTRKDLATQYLSHILRLQLYVLALRGYVDLPAYVDAIARRNEVIRDAITNSRWTGINFPDIDPLKTANYLRKMLGSALDNAPLMTLSAAAEHAQQGDYDAITEQVGEEMEWVNEAGIPPVDPGTPQPQPTTTEEREVEDTGDGS